MKLTITNVNIIMLLIILPIITIALYNENKQLNSSIVTQPEIVTIVTEEISFLESIELKSLQDEIKTKNKIITLDNKIFVNHSRELELYGDFIVAILKGDDREERLMREDTLKAGAQMTDIRKEIEELIKLRKEL